uniref:fructose-bisphosphate aldolase n=2 Tax=Chromera velia TaxID=505693 RepID=X2D8N7_9ALVE|nr:class I fructose-1,6-bisphosphate aldolase [Chromera velia]|eukprot:Cvel_5088.t1-p1 / transcript=Cvel_5088.t1 / gene=Cvel_5088 / organism=Chromera_velia_CCMP2878 / gene_product=Fructose-bisphosphate aldolase B, putative / transcript_product=Fructose-bisphosphate aldolase B, putative / location=Cvel_scaffold232:40758-49042(-) / protein_length=471 / sequence_SO=supercontig / SO=protein_coding / is_pseudo=false
MAAPCILSLVSLLLILRGMEAYMLSRGSHLKGQRGGLFLRRIADRMTKYGKGLTACDESAGTIGVRFERVGIENSEENRRRYRQLLFETSAGPACLSGAILDPETLFQNHENGQSFPSFLKSRGISVGVKPHLKVAELPGTGGETVMQGLDSLADRLKEYKKAGAEFTKWRSPIKIDTRKGLPTALAIESNMRDLARFALISQMEGLVPIVEPDVLMEGDHDLRTARKVNEEIQSVLWRECIKHGVDIQSTVLKTSLVLPGKNCKESFTVREIARQNLVAFANTVPPAMPGIVFLSGGQPFFDVAARLSALNSEKPAFGVKHAPWQLSFSWSAALQLPVMELCRGKEGEMPLDDMAKLYAQELKIASLAARGKYNFDQGRGDHKGEGGGLIKGMQAESTRWRRRPQRKRKEKEQAKTPDPTTATAASSSSPEGGEGGVSPSTSLSPQTEADAEAAVRGETKSELETATSPS